MVGLRIRGLLVVALLAASSCGSDGNAGSSTGAPAADSTAAAALSTTTNPGATDAPGETSASNPGSTETVEPGGEILIGDILSKSGSLTIALPADVGLRVAVNEINADGGVVVGGKAYTFAVKEIDDRSDAAASAAAARELLQDGAQIIFGPNGAGAASVLELTRANKVIMVSASSGASAQLENDDPQYLLTALPSAEDRGEAAVAALHEAAPDAMTIAMLGPDDSTMAAIVGAVTPAWEAAGGTAESILYPTGTSDLAGFLAKVSADDPDVLYIGYNGPTVTLALEQLDAAGISDDMVILGHGTGPALASSAGGRPFLALELSSGALTGDGANPKSAELVEKYFAAAGESELPPYPPSIRYYYDIMYMLADAIEGAGSTDDTAAILAQILGTDYTYDGALGTISFNDVGFIEYPLVSTFVAAEGTETTLTWTPAD